MSKYTDGSYFEMNPTWHVEDSPWKTRHVMAMLKRNNILPGTIAEVGCGAGENLVQLKAGMPDTCTFTGYELSPQAMELCRQREGERISYYLGDILEVSDRLPFDLVMALDVFEHVEDYFGFLRHVRGAGLFKMFHIPLDMSVRSVWKVEPILEARKKVGHLHYFCKETALETLLDCGYEVIDHCYTSGPIDRPASIAAMRTSMGDALKKPLYLLSPDWWVRILGGSMLVLAR